MAGDQTSRSRFKGFVGPNEANDRRRPALQKGANVIRIAPQPRHIQAQRRYANIRNATPRGNWHVPFVARGLRKIGRSISRWKPHWPRFWISNKANGTQTVHSLKHRTGFDRLEPIAFADFDGDGESEALFMLSGYVRDGYVLLFDGMNRKAMFAWAYHRSTAQNKSLSSIRQHLHRIHRLPFLRISKCSFDLIRIRITHLGDLVALLNRSALFHHDLLVVRVG